MIIKNRFALECFITSTVFFALASGVATMAPPRQFRHLHKPRVERVIERKRNKFDALYGQRKHKMWMHSL